MERFYIIFELGTNMVSIDVFTFCKGEEHQKLGTIEMTMDCDEDREIAEFYPCVDYSEYCSQIDSVELMLSVLNGE